MTKKKTLYEQLGVEPTASKEQIKRAYKKKAAKLHPDVNKEPDAEQQFKEVCNAYMILYDDQSRYKYDSTGFEEKPSDRKPVDVEEAAKVLLYRTVFALIDKMGEFLTENNLQDKLRATLVDAKKEVKDRMRNNKGLWKAAKRKRLAVIKKQTKVQRDSLLYKILETKLNHIDTQEILPVKEKIRSLLTDRAIIKRASELVEKDCVDYTVETQTLDPLQAWDRAMNNTFFDVRGMATGTSTGKGPF